METALKRTESISVASKLNLSLNVTGTNGKFHALDSVVTSVNLYDTITVTLNGSGAITSKVRCEGEFATCQEFELPLSSPTLKATRLMTDGAHIEIIKRIPFSGGMGGSSADTAGVIVCLSKLLNKNPNDVLANATKNGIGSDTRYMTRGGFARICGTGEDVTFYNTKQRYHFVIATDLSGVDTTACYVKFDELYKDKKCVLSNNDELIKRYLSGERFTSFMHNALLEPALSLNPKISELIDIVSGISEKAFMTGAGSVVAGLCDSFDKATASAVLLKRKGYTAIAVTTCDGGKRQI